ncbi:MAG: hypothetical protein EPN26_01080 [Rhodospirillales bacterium]|nr:MAG: hypothetical protein EPN26_01080 [Rhodospirillales bacterium]
MCGVRVVRRPAGGGPTNSQGLDGSGSAGLVEATDFGGMNLTRRIGFVDVLAELVDPLMGADGTVLAFLVGLVELLLDRPMDGPQSDQDGCEYAEQGGQHGPSDRGVGGHAGSFQLTWTRSSSQTPEIST